MAEDKKPSAFRIDTDIYLDESKPPVKHTLTLFSGGLYYDFEDGEQGKITVFDPARNRVVLLDRRRQLKSTLPLQPLQSTVIQARTQADSKFTAVLDCVYELRGNEPPLAIVKNDSMEYRATAQPVPHVDISHQYNDFADWSARLNSIYPPKLPPFLRMDLNRLFVEHQTIPSEIRRRTREGHRESEIIAKLIPIWRLSQDDQARIARCGTMMAEFREVPDHEYWQMPADRTALAPSITAR